MKKIRINGSCLQYVRSRGKCKGFTLLELVFALCIGLIILLAIGSLMQGSLKYSKSYGEKFQKESDKNYALDGIMEEILAADSILTCRTNRLDFSLYQEKGKEAFVDGNEVYQKYYYKYISYQLDKGNLKRLCVNTTEDIDSVNFKSKGAGINNLLSSVGKFSPEIRGDLLILNWEIDGKKIQQYIALRGDKYEKN